MRKVGPVMLMNLVPQPAMLNAIVSVAVVAFAARRAWRKLHPWKGLVEHAPSLSLVLVTTNVADHVGAAIINDAAIENR
jgi:hypothetical protein